MIRKIKRDEYQKGYETMSDGERKGYLSRVGEWLGDGGRRLMELTERPMAKSQNIVLLSARWKEPEVAAFTEGARLLSALVGLTETWLPTQLYAKSAYRAVRQMTVLLGEASGFRLQVSGGGDGIATQRTKKALPMIREVSREYDAATDTVRVKMEVVPAVTTPAGKPQDTVPAGESAGTNAAGNGRRLNPAEMNVPTISDALKQGMVLARPRHIDQYVHLLPEATQKRAAAYGELMREFDVSREKLRIVMDDSQASDMDREQWAKRVSKLDRQIGDIRRELDAEWEKVAASGRVVVDELGMAHLISEELRVKSEEFATAQGGGTAEPETAVADDNQRKAALLRKWLIDTRYGNKDAEKRAKQQEKWREKYLEMVRLGGMEAVTEKVREAAKHYEIDIEALSSTTN